VNGRWVTADAEFQGHVVPKGSTLLLLNGSGNRDDATFLILIDSTSGAMSIVTYRSAMGRTSVLAPRSLASKVRWLCGRCSSGSQPWEVDYDRAEMVHISTVRGYARLPVRV
jgi:hypothetical protein